MLTLTAPGGASVAEFQTALQHVVYSSTAGDPTVGGTDTSRTITWSSTDTNGTVSTDETNTLSVMSPPQISAGGTVTFTGGGAPAALDSGLTISDPESATLSSATVSIGSFQTGDNLDFLNQGDIAGSYDTGTGTLTLTGTDTIANYQAALRSITYGFVSSNGDPTNGGSNTSRTITWAVNDGTSNSSAATSSIDTVHAPPVASTGGTAVFTTGGNAPPVAPELTVSDPDSSDALTGATVEITSGYLSGDIVDFTAQNGISGFYSGGTLTLNGNATIADYQAALRSITFSSSAGDPTNSDTDTSRTIVWAVSDGTANSSAVSSTVDVNNPPSQVAITSGSFTAHVGDAASGGPITVTLEDTLGNPVPAVGGGGVVVALSSSSARGVFSDTAGGSPVTSVTIPDGDDAASFYYGDGQVGAPTIMASASGLGNAIQKKRSTRRRRSPQTITRPSALPASVASP